jgi:hypothetical protein
MVSLAHGLMNFAPTFNFLNILNLKKKIKKFDQSQIFWTMG